jgi:hypothetical protein
MNGHVHLINEDWGLGDILNNAAPTSGTFVAWPWSNTKVTALYYPMPFPDPGVAAWEYFPCFVNFGNTAADGSFTIPDPPPNFLNISKSVSIRVGDPPFVMYRSAIFPIAHAHDRALDLFVKLQDVPDSDGLSAGAISAQMVSFNQNQQKKGNVQLPDGTTITSGPGHLNFTGDLSGVTFNFNVALKPDTSVAMDSLVDTTAQIVSVKVPDGPVAWHLTLEGQNAHTIADSIRSAVAGVGNSMTPGIWNKIGNEISAKNPEAGTGPQIAKQLADNLTITLLDMRFPNQGHSWNISKQNDQTIVVATNVALGWPLSFLH